MEDGSGQRRPTGRKKGGGRKGVYTDSVGVQDDVDGGLQTETHVIEARNDVHQQQRYPSERHERRVDDQVEYPTQRTRRTQTHTHTHTVQ